MRPSRPGARALLIIAAMALPSCSAPAKNGPGGRTAAVPAGQDEGQRQDEPAPRTGTIALDTGVELFYTAQGPSQGEPVIFLHGYTDSHHSFDLVLPDLAPDIRVYALDQRGHGDSSKPACCYQQSDFVADLIAFMDAHDIPRAILVGHSMGSFIAHQAAVTHPDRVSGLVLIGSAPTSAGNPGVIEFLEVVNGFTDPIDPEFIRAFQAGTALTPLPEDFLELVIRESQKVPATVWQQALAGLATEDHGDALSRITAPTLILWGDKDELFPAADQQALADAIPGATLETYAGVGHGLHWEAPARAARDITHFVRER